MGITLLCQNYLTEISAHDNDKADFSAVAHTEFRPSLNVNTFIAENPLHFICNVEETPKFSRVRMLAFRT